MLYITIEVNAVRVNSRVAIYEMFYFLCIYLLPFSVDTLHFSFIIADKHTSHKTIIHEFTKGGSAENISIVFSSV